MSCAIIQKKRRTKMLYISICSYICCKIKMRNQQNLRLSSSTDYLPIIITSLRISLGDSFLGSLRRLFMLMPGDWGECKVKVAQVYILQQQLPSIYLKASIMIQAAREIKDVLYVSEPTCRNFTQHFQFFNQLITHQHQVEVTHLQQEELLEIRNYLTVEKEGKLLKVTEITLENRMIRIIDSISCASNPNLSSFKHEGISDPQSNIKKVQPAKKTTFFRVKDPQQPKVKLKDTKNVVKNIIRMFQSWLEEGFPSLRAAYDQLTGFVKHIKYNNHLIIKLLRNPSLCAAFIQFSRSDGKEFIQKSKINDKNSHFEALQRFSQLFEKEQRSRENREEAPIEVMVASE